MNYTKLKLARDNFAYEKAMKELGVDQIMINEEISQRNWNKSMEQI